MPIDKSFVFSINSIFVASASLLSLIAFICVISGRTNICDDIYGGAAYSFFEFVSVSVFLTLLFSWLFYTLTLSRRVFLRRIPWVLIDLVYNAVFIVFYLIANIVIAVKSCDKDSNKAGSVFGFLAMFCMVGVSIFQFRLLKIQRVDAPPPESSREQPAEPAREQY